MGKVTLAFPVERISGKVNKKDNAYFNNRNGKNFLNRIVNPYKGDPTANQVAAQDKFKEAAANARAIMANKTGAEYIAYEVEWKKGGTGYATLWGYVFNEEYKK